MADFRVKGRYFREGGSCWRITTGETTVTTSGQPKSLIINVRLEPVPWRRYWWESLKRRFAR